MCHARMQSLPGSDSNEGGWGLANIQLNTVSIFPVINKKFRGTVTLSVPFYGILRSYGNLEIGKHPAV